MSIKFNSIEVTIHVRRDLSSVDQKSTEIVVLMTENRDFVQRYFCYFHNMYAGGGTKHSVTIVKLS